MPITSYIPTDLVFDMPQKAVPAKADLFTFGSITMELIHDQLLIINENHALSLCTYVEGFHKSSHIIATLTICQFTLNVTQIHMHVCS